MNDVKNIGVFCGARSTEKFEEVAFECGKMLGKKGYNLVYGGACGGLMGILSESARSHGAKVIGVFPTCLSGNNERFNPDVDEPIIVEDMMRRKDIMIARSDAFIILPGGFGTLDEFFEIITLKNLRLHNKPIVIINYLGYWNKLLELLDFVVDNGFANSEATQHFIVVDSIEEASVVI